MNSFPVIAIAAIGSLVLGWQLRKGVRAAAAHRAAVGWLRESLRERRLSFGAALTAWPTDFSQGPGAAAARLGLASALRAIECCAHDTGTAALSAQRAGAERRLSRAWENVLFACEADPALDAFVPQLEAPTEHHNRAAVAAALVRSTAARHAGRQEADRTLDLFGDPDDAWFALHGHLPTRSGDRALRSQVAPESRRSLT